LIAAYAQLEERIQQLNQELDQSKRLQKMEVLNREKISEKYVDLLRLLPAGVIVLDKHGFVTEANLVAEALLGIALLGKPWRSVIEQCFGPRDDDGHEVSLKNGKRIKLETQALLAQAGQIVVLNDLTATRELQRKVSQNERLTAIGQMSSALAHQIRTPLSAALLHAGNLRDMPLNAEQSKRFATKVCDSLQHIEAQVRDMLVFSRANMALDDTVRLGDFMLQVLDLATARYKKERVTLMRLFILDKQVLDLDHSVDAANHIVLQCNKEVLVGALLNLLDNALEASSFGCEVVLRFEVETDLSIIVEDNGPGMDPLVLQRVQSGEAFVTSKSQGTGLGLTVARAVALAHKGYLTVESHQGTEVGFNGLKIERKNITIEKRVAEKRAVENTTFVNSAKSISQKQIDESTV